MKAKTSANTSEEVYNSWYDAVYEPQQTAVEPDIDEEGRNPRRVNRYREFGQGQPPARLHEMEEIKMAVTKTIEIDGKQVKFKASAAVPRLYRVKFGRDIYKDLRMLEKSVGDNDEDASNMDLFSLELFEDLAWLMARHASPEEVPDNPEDFLDQFNTFSDLPDPAPAH